MKEYTKPVAEKVDFEFKNQVVASGGSESDQCDMTTTYKKQAGSTICQDQGSSTLNW